MSYPNGTILVRDEMKGDKFDRLSVVGPSPIKTASIGEWGGAAGDSVIVNPIGEVDGQVAFSSPEILPIRAAGELYSIEWEPDPAPTHIESQPPPRAVRQLTAEEQFRNEARGRGVQGTNRERTPIKHRG